MCKTKMALMVGHNLRESQFLKGKRAISGEVLEECHQSQLLTVSSPQKSLKRSLTPNTRKAGAEIPRRALESVSPSSVDVALLTLARLSSAKPWETSHLILLRLRQVLYMCNAPSLSCTYDAISRGVDLHSNCGCKECRLKIENSDLDSFGREGGGGWSNCINRTGTYCIFVLILCHEKRLWTCCEFPPILRNCSSPHHT